MTRRDKIRLVVLVAVLGGLALTLALTIKRPTGPTKGFTDNVIVQHRKTNLGKSRQKDLGVDYLVEMLP